jgi:NADH dehydrogenase [ubiquinone] 1 alpha subcomplex assembly factor 1
MSDLDIGGFSTANLDFIPPSPTDPAHARFHGSISMELPPNKPEVHRTGFAGFRTFDRRPTLFGRGLWDIDPYAFLALKVKSDGRPYYVNIQTESIVPTDLHQHRLYVKRVGVWETVLINFYDFVRTNGGQRVEPQSELLRMKVKSVGLSLIDRKEEPYDLRIAGIWAVNGLGALEEELAKQEEEEQRTVELQEVGNTTQQLGSQKHAASTQKAIS